MPTNRTINIANQSNLGRAVDHDNHFNLFRSLFALQVVYMHSHYWLNLPKGGEFLFSLLEAFPGVPLFFMVSGFLITDSYLNSGTLSGYCFKRALRIYPALFVNILILEMAMFLGGNMRGNPMSALDYASYFLTYVGSASSGIAAAILGLKGDDIYNYGGFFTAYPSRVLWTLTVELSFYLILPVVLVSRHVWVRSTILGLLSVVAVGISTCASKEFYDSTSATKLLEISAFPYMWIFGLGVAFRLHWQVIRGYLVDRGLVFIGVYLVYCLGMYFFRGRMGSYHYALDLGTVVQTVLLAVAMFSMAFSHTRFKILRKLDLSYSTYLYHMLFVQILIGFGIGESGILYVIVAGATLCTAYLSWTYIEKPILALKRRSQTKAV